MKRNGPAARTKARAFYCRRKCGTKAATASPFFSQTPDRPGFWTMLFGKLTKGKRK